MSRHGRPGRSRAARKRQRISLYYAQLKDEVDRENQRSYEDEMGREAQAANGIYGL